MAVFEAPVRLSFEQLYQQHIKYVQTAYERAIAAARFDAMVIHSGRAVLKSRFDDQHWPFRPTPTFAHWLPLCKPDVALLVQPGRKPVLLSPVGQDYWEGEREPESYLFRDVFECIELSDMNSVRAHLPGGRVAFVGNSPNAAEGYGLGAEAINPTTLVAALAHVRARKTAYERECIAEANRRAARGHRALQEAFAAGGQSELQLHLLYLATTLQDGAETPYKNIVALDEHAAVLHHVHYGRVAPVGTSQSLLVDAGATCLGYASDITRTAARGSEAAPFQTLIEAVDKLQAKVIARITPGTSFESLHDAAHELLAGALRDLGIASASAEELVASGATRAFFPHGLGHSLGIQVHDVGMKPAAPRADNPFLRNTSTIADGQVFTIEPGCYFIPALMDKLRTEPVAARIDWSLVDRLSRFGGVRIEDNIAIVDGGTVNITRDNWSASP